MGNIIAIVMEIVSTVMERRREYDVRSGCPSHEERLRNENLQFGKAKISKEEDISQLTTFLRLEDLKLVGIDLP